MKLMISKGSQCRANEGHNIIFQRDCIIRVSLAKRSKRNVVY